MKFEEWGEKRSVDAIHDGLSVYADWEAEREKHLTQLTGQNQKIERLEMKLDASRKIRRYSAFVLTGNENWDLQIAADQVKAEIEQLRDKNKRVQEELNECRSKVAQMAVEKRYGQRHNG